MGETRSVQSSAVPAGPQIVSGGALQSVCQGCGLFLLISFLEGQRVGRHPYHASCPNSSKLFDIKTREAIPRESAGKPGLDSLSSLNVSLPAVSLESPEMPGLVCELIWASDDLADMNIIRGDHRDPAKGLVEGGNQVCAGCVMHSLGRSLTHTPSCRVGRVISILDRMRAVQAQPTAAVINPGRRKEDARTEEARAEAGTPSRVDAGEFGEPWKFAFGPNSVEVQNCDDYKIAAMSGAVREQKEHADRITACVNFCEGIPTEVLAAELPLASLGRKRWYEIQHLRKALPFLPELAVRS